MLSSERLQFRKMVEHDIEKYHSWRYDFDVMQEIGVTSLINIDTKKLKS